MTDGDAEAIRTAKAVLRTAVRFRRDARPEQQRRRDDLARLGQLTDALPDGPPAVVAAYLSTGSEPGTLPLVGWLAAHDVRVLLPVLTADDGSLRTAPAWADYAGPDALRSGRMSIPEPTGPVLPDGALRSADLVVCPAVAATVAGDRLGRGGGWYDRVLAEVIAPVWTLVNDDEVLETVPTQSWDRRVEGVVTQRRFVRCARG